MTYGARITTPISYQELGLVCVCRQRVPKMPLLSLTTKGGVGAVLPQPAVPLLRF